MTDSNGTCEYVLDPEDPETWGGEQGDECYVDEDMLNDEGLWTCPYETKGGDNLCLFHQPVDDKEDEEVTAEILDVLNNSQESEKAFIGSKFGSIVLEERHIRSEVDTLSFCHSTFERIEFIDIRFSVGVDFSGARLAEESYFNGSIFDSIVHFVGVETSTVHFPEVRFEDKVRIRNSTFGLVYFSAAYFSQDTQFYSLEFTDGVSLERAQFDGICSFYETTITRTADFSNAVFNDEANFWKTNFDDKVEFTNTEFFGEVFFRETEFDIEERIWFIRSTFRKKADFMNIDLSGADFRMADLTDADFTEAKLCDVNFESALLSRATLFRADLRGAKINGAVLGDARIDEDTQFLGHPDDDSNSSPHTFSAIRSKSCCVYDPNYDGDSESDVDKAKSVYRALEELAGKAAQTRLQSQCFVRRQDLQKDGYKQDAKKADSWQERLIAGTRYSRAKVARGTLLYGESPWRIIGGSIGFIVLVSLFYPLGEWLRPTGGEAITYSRILGGEWSLLLESLYYSTLTFTTLGMGDYEPMGFGQVLATLNTALGAVLIALLVFVLGRRAAR
jgi:uncharacterized protein YjbI with pentapeptide repeats